MNSMKRFLILILILCLFIIPEEVIPKIRIGIIQQHNYEFEDDFELVTPQIGSYKITTKTGSLTTKDQFIKVNSYYIQITLSAMPFSTIQIKRSTDLITWTTEFEISSSLPLYRYASDFVSLCKDGNSVYGVFLLVRSGTTYDIGWCVSTDDGATWTNGSGGADGTYNLSSSGDGYGVDDDSQILSTCVISNVEYAILYSKTPDTVYVIRLSDFSSITSAVYDKFGQGDVYSNVYYFPAVIDGETSVKLIQFNGAALSTHSTVSTDVNDLGTGKSYNLFATNNGIFYIYTISNDGVDHYYNLWKYQDSTWTKHINEEGTIPISYFPSFIVYDYVNNEITNIISNNASGLSKVYHIDSNGIIYLTYLENYTGNGIYGAIDPYISKNSYMYEWSYAELTNVSDCVIKKDGTASFNDYFPTTRFYEKQYVELYNSSNNLVYQGFITKIDRIDLIQKLVHLKALANYDLEKQLSDSYTTKTYYEMIETSIDTHGLYLTYSLDHTPVTTYTMEHKKTLAELIKWGTKQESLKDYVTPASVLTIDDGTTDTTIDVSDVDGDVIDEYKSYEITYNPSIVILYGGFVNGVRITSTWRSTVIGDQPFSDNYPEVVDQTQLDNLAEAIGTGKDFKILVFEFTVFNKDYIQPGQQIDFQYTLDQTNYPVLASKAKYYVISNEINLSQDSQFIRISDALIDEAKGEQKNGLTVENAFQLVEQVQGNVNTLETDSASTYLKKTGVETQNLLLKDAEASALDIKEGANSYLKFTTSNGGEVITAGKPLAMGTNKITGLGAATAANDALSTGNLETTPTNGATTKAPNSDWAYKIESEAVTLAGVKTFSSFPLTPSSLPTTSYQVANKLYVDNKSIVLYKPDGENRTDTNFASDGDLTASFSASSVYKFRFVLFFTALPGAGDVKIRVHCSSAPTLIQGMGAAFMNLGTTAASMYNFALDANDEEILNKDNASDYNDSMMIIEGMVFTNGATTFEIQWAQRADSGTTTMGAGSYFEYSKVA